MQSEVKFTQFESNGHGVFVLTGKQVAIKEGKKQGTAACLIFPVSFFPDALKLEGMFWPGRDGIFIKKPSMPTPFYSHYESVLYAMAVAVDPKNPCVCEQTKLTYETEATRIASSDKYKYDILSVGFVDGVTCNNREFNEGVEGDHQLVTRVATMYATDPAFKDASGKSIPFPMSFAWWRFIVDGSEQLAQTPQKKNQEAEVRKMMHALNLSGSGTPVQGACVQRGCVSLCFIENSLAHHHQNSFIT